MLYPLKFHPIIKQTIWGGVKLAYKSTDIKSSIGESWEISGVQDNVSVVSDGALAGNSLEELTEIYMGDLVGDAVYEKFGIEFPLLIKYIDACDDLSIQVHPDDKTAKERHNAYGKTEMWYVVDTEGDTEVDTEKDAKILMGFNKDTDKSEYLTRLHNNTLTEILNVEKAQKGDCFFIPAGTVHAICKGCLLAEIQQTSDITYRIYDYDRKDKNGLPRELHTELATDVITFKKQSQHAISYHRHKNEPQDLVACNYFTTKYIHFDKELERDYIAMGIDSFVIYMCLDGDFVIAYNTRGTSKFVKVTKGETVLLPAIFKQVSLIPKNAATILEVYV
ncbi:mannose-6-phosphate isomerase [Bacteroidia bacterium]|nr:mannose-6-phosphate isomerase [Bacteroidia bacterium]